MSGCLNRVQLIGHLGADPDARTLASGGQVVSLRLATSESWTDKASGGKRERTDWHNVVIFNEPLGKVALSYLKKGSKALIEGALRTRKYQAQDGSDRYVTEVVLSGFDGQLILLGEARGGGRPPPADGPDSYGGSVRERHSRGQAPASGNPARRDDLDDDIPF